MPERDRSLDATSVDVRSFRHGHDDQPSQVRKTKKTRRLPQRSKPLTFVSTHHHSTFSFLDGFQLPEAHVRRAAEIGMGTMALTEHGNVSSHVQLESAAKKHGIKPIFGVELYCGALDENRAQRKNHLTVLSEDLNGYRNLLRLVTSTYAEGFYYEPTADDAMLARYSKGLVFLSGCLGSLLATSCIGGKLVQPEDASYRRGRGVAQRFKKQFGDAYYIEVQAFPELDASRLLNPMLARISRELKIPMVVTFDCHYTVPEENEIQKILHNVRDGSKQTLEEQSRNWGYDVALCPPWTDTTIVRKLVATGLTRQEAIKAILVSAEIGERCNVQLPSLPMVRYPLPRSYKSNIDLWRDWLRDGWRYRGLHRLSPHERSIYKRRLKVETDLIESKDFVDYFLVVSDAIRWAKDHDIAVGPARGSAAGSLACWLLRITEVNPVPYPDLIFERFIDITREDLPDIDLDFDSENRGRVRDYLVSKYGAECVGNVANFTGYKGKNALDDVARVFRVPKWEIEKIKDVLIERSSGDLRASATIEDTVEQFEAAREVFEKHGDLAYALELEGNYKGMGVHAAGLVVSAGPLTEVAALYERTVKGEVLQVISMDKYDAEKKGLLKLDFLGLSTMTMLNKCRQQMGWSLDDLYNLPLNDEEVIDAFKRNDVTGIFQYEGRAMRYVNGALKPDSFEEVVLVNALSRPGPLHNGAANEYIDIKMGRKKPELLHPSLESICSKTNYQIVYQEQILRIMGEVFNFDWTHRAEIRRIISRKIGEQEFNRRWERAKEGAKLLHPDMPEEVAKAIWGMCITAGSYAFNACATGDTTIIRGGAGGNRSGENPQSPEITLTELYAAQQSNTAWGTKLRDPKRGITILQMDADGKVRPGKVKAVVHQGQEQTFIIKTKSGKSIRITANHRLLTSDGYKRADALLPGEELVIMGQPDRKPLSSGRGHKAGATRVSQMGHRPGVGNWIDGRYKFFTQAKLEVDARANGICEICGKMAPEENHHEFEYSHIKTLEQCGGDYKRYHSSKNIKFLCNSCHKKFDYKQGTRVKRWTRGRLTELDEIVSISKGEIEDVYDVIMDTPEHNFIANGIVSHNSHCVAYSTVGAHTMWFKQHEPELFYAESLNICGGDKEREQVLLRDAVRHQIDIAPPDVKHSKRQWSSPRHADKDNYEDGEQPYIQAGFAQIPGIGGKTADSILGYRDEHGFSDWNDLTRIQGIGPVTVKKITDYVAAEDPHGAFWLDRAIGSVKEALRRGMKAHDKRGNLIRLPNPTHVAADLPYTRGRDIEVVWLGTIHTRNVRDIFEWNRAKTGEELKPEDVKDPHLNEWIVMVGDDESDQMGVRVTRWNYPIFRERLWKMTPGKDLLLVRGVKPGWMPIRQLTVWDCWVIEP